MAACIHPSRSIVCTLDDIAISCEGGFADVLEPDGANAGLEFLESTIDVILGTLEVGKLALARAERLLAEWEHSATPGNFGRCEALDGSAGWGFALEGVKHLRIVEPEFGAQSPNAMSFIRVALFDGAREVAFKRDPEPVEVGVDEVPVPSTLGEAVHESV